MEIAPIEMILQSNTNLNYPNFITLHHQSIEIGRSEFDNISFFVKGERWHQNGTNCELKSEMETLFVILN